MNIKRGGYTPLTTKSANPGSSTPEKLAVERWERVPQMKSGNNSKKGRSAALVPTKQEVHAMG